MKSKLLFLVLSIFFINSYSQNLIAVQNGGTPSFYIDLSEAIEGAVSGDTLYLPSQNYVVNDTIRKKIHLIGVGYHPDFSQGSGTTTLSKTSSLSTQLHFENGSQGSSITGIRFESTNTNQGYTGHNITSDSEVENLVITRNYFKAGISLSSSGSFIVENFFGNASIFNSENGASSLVSNNVFFGRGNSYRNCAVNNNIFTNKPNYYSTFNCYNSIFKNNIFTKYPFYGGYNAHNSTFYNNVNMSNGSLQQGSVGIGNVNTTDDISVIFNENSWTTFLTSGSDFKFELPSDSPYLTFAVDGGQVGIYGGRFPWKEGSIPFNPHIVSKNISGTTDENGNIPVTIEVQAQGN